MLLTSTGTKPLLQVSSLANDLEMIVILSCLLQYLTLFGSFIVIVIVILLKVPLWSKKSLPFFLEILKVCLLSTGLPTFWPLIFIQKLFTLRVNFGFHHPPLLTFKPDRLDLRGLDPGKVTSKAHQLKISACERSLLYMQSASLKVWKPKTPVLHINSVAYTQIAFLN